LVGSFGGAIGGVFSIAVAMWYVNFAQGRMKKNVQAPQEISNVPHCAKCNSPNLVKDDSGVYCGKCGASFSSMIEPSPSPQPQIGQPEATQTQQTETQETGEGPQVTKKIHQSIIYVCSSCFKELASKQGLLHHVKKKHPSPITT
jgi:ribosomal protein L37AE/L43A